MDKPRIIFMGTPEFSVPSIEILWNNGYPLVAVVTQPDRPQGRGRTEEPSPVKRFATARNMPVLQPERVRDREFIERFRDIDPDMVVLVSFGQILPREIIEGPRLGCLNVHPSLLPKYRGAAPMQWALIRGETTTGVTIMMMDEGVDSGDILLQEETPIEADESFGNVHNRLADRGAALILRAIELLTLGRAKSIAQEHSLATYAPRLKKEDGLINWHSPVETIVNLIRGLSPTPCAYAFLDKKMLKIFSAVGEEAPTGDVAGKVCPLAERGLPVAAADGYVYLREVQLQGRKRMSIQEFLRGYRFAPETVLS